jgi:hypothetical protein
MSEVSLHLRPRFGAALMNAFRGTRLSRRAHNLRRYLAALQNGSKCQNGANCLTKIYLTQSIC